MAFKSTTSSSSSYHDLSSISGVPVKINEKYTAPKKVTLPLQLETSFQTQNPSEVLFMEYNFELEEKVIEWSEAYRQSQEAYNVVETEKVGDTIEQFSRLQAEGVTGQPEPISDDECNFGYSTDPSTETKDAHVKEEVVMPPQSNPNGDLAQNPSSSKNAGKPTEQGNVTVTVNPFMQNVGTGILVPMQVPVKSQGTGGAGHSEASKGSFDLADFEREQDPFDNAEMRVMNDLEELNKVLQNVQTAKTESPNAEQQSAEGPANQGQDNQRNNVQAPTNGLGVQMSDSNVQPNLNLVHPTSQPGQTSQPKSIKEIEYPELESLDSSVNGSLTNRYSSNPTGAVSSSVTSVQNSSASGQSLYSPPNSFVQAGMRPNVNSYPGLQSAMMGNVNSGNPFAGSAAMSNSFTGSNPYSVAGTTNPFATNLVSNLVAANPQTVLASASNPFSNHMVRYNKQTDSAYMLPAVNSSNQTHQAPSANQNNSFFGFSSHGASQVPQHNAAATNSDTFGGQRLRSCRSTPDISALSDNAPVHFPTSHTPPPNPQVQQAYIDREKQRRSSELFRHAQPNQKSLFSDTNPWGSYPSKSVSQTTSSIVSASTNSATASSSTQWNGYSHRNISSPSPAPIPAPKPKTSSLPDPYQTMPKESQNLVNNIAAMGFSRSCVARTVKKLGTDDKQVIDFLCLVTRLSDKGYAADDVEGALGLYDSKEDKAEAYLKLLSQLSDLGFSKDKIKDALVDSKLDENKALDILTGNS